MGAMQNNAKAGKGRAAKRGSVNNARRLDTFRKGAGNAQADWGGCDERRIQGVIVAITELGGAITFGLSRDKGAHSLTIMLDGERETLWFNGKADLTEEMDGVKATLDAMA